MPVRFLIALGSLLISVAVFGGKSAGPVAQGFYVDVKPRTTVQMSAFYEARGFSDTGLAELGNYCFFTVLVRNNSPDVVWLEPSRWRIRSVNDGQSAGTAPLDQEYWQRKWPDIGLSKAMQATFRWTQLPAQRDLQPDEPVGGNIAIRRIEGPLELEMVFDTGQDRSGSQIYRKFGDLGCGGDLPPNQDKKG